MKRAIRFALVVFLAVSGMAFNCSSVPPEQLAVQTIRVAMAAQNANTRFTNYQANADKSEASGWVEVGGRQTWLSATTVPGDTPLTISYKTASGELETLVCSRFGTLKSAVLTKNGAKLQEWSQGSGDPDGYGVVCQALLPGLLDKIARRLAPVTL